MNCVHPGCTAEGITMCGSHTEWDRFGQFHQVDHYLCVAHFAEFAEEHEHMHQAVQDAARSLQSQVLWNEVDYDDINRLMHELGGSNMPFIEEDEMSTTEPPTPRPPITERTINHIIAIAVGILAAISAHVSGKPWWVDHPFGGDAFDVGMVTFLMLRGFFWLFGEERSNDA